MMNILKKLLFSAKFQKAIFDCAFTIATLVFNMLKEEA